MSGWSFENGQFTCEDEHHAVVPAGWICEPCEKCGSDIESVDYAAPEYEEVYMSDSSHSSTSILMNSGYYRLHPCGHFMRTLDFGQVI